ncbi:MAG: hypothetical protein JRI64_07055 [Deltaproteobacteria bacterium]|nr:hypothetical protein [Deltaproteobacteria bacterium]
MGIRESDHLNTTGLSLSGSRAQREGSRWLKMGIVCAATVILVLQIRFIGDWRVDDAYITFSYSKNLASGNGPVYGYDLRVEGYSNLLWMVLLALPMAIFPDGDPTWIARVVTLPFLILMGVTTYRFIRRRAPPWRTAVMVLVLAFWTDLTLAALSGLETVPHAALLGASLLLYTSRDWRTRRWTWVVCLAVGLMRIDGFVQIGVLVGWDLLLCPKERRLISRRGVWWFITPVLIYLVYFALRWAYYGLPLPLTYYAKTMAETGDRLWGYRYLWLNLRIVGLLVVMPVAAIALIRKPRADVLLLWLLFLAQCIYAVVVGGDWMPFARLLLPVVPLIIVAFAWGNEELVGFVRDHQSLAFLSFGGRAGRTILAYALPVAMTVLVVVHLDSHIVASPLEAMKIDLAEEQKRHVRKNLYTNRYMFQQILRAPGQTLVTDYGGMVAYYTNARIIEMWGLCNREIALRGNTDGINPIYGKTCIDCYVEFDPDYFHVRQPLARPPDAFDNHQDVIDEVFQGAALDRVLDLRRNFVTGRVIDENRNLALFFLERVRPGVTFESRRPAIGFRVDYPFLDVR